jgi:hypothetical protein
MLIFLTHMMLLKELATEDVFIPFRFICFVTVVEDVYFTSIKMRGGGLVLYGGLSVNLGNTVPLACILCIPMLNFELLLCGKDINLKHVTEMC